VVELKGKASPSAADLDQAEAYARDLRAYHAECEHRTVHAVLVPTLAKGGREKVAGVHVCPPELLNELLVELNSKSQPLPVDPRRFLSQEAYRPLPSLVRAARELFSTGSLRRVHRAAAATEGTTEQLLRLASDAARQKRRKLVLIAGVPGAGKTLVGLRLVHAHQLDALAIDRGNGKPTAPAVFLSGNGPLVEVLAYELRDAGGNGRTFVRGVKQYVERYLNNAGLVPPEHVLVYDEAQRAYDSAMVAEKHKQESAIAKSEPEMFIEFAQRVPEWCVVVALIGTGQEIHKGEEGGVRQWAKAIAGEGQPGAWDIHGPPSLSREFEGFAYSSSLGLNLDKSLRSHLAYEVHELVAAIVGDVSVSMAATAFLGVQEGRASYVVRDDANSLPVSRLVDQVRTQGHHLRASRNLEAAKAFLRDRYSNDATARYGILASSRDRDLPRFGIHNDYQSTKRTKFGPWYGDDESEIRGLSCRHLRECVTEFGAQGLELDGALLAWGTDYMLQDGTWTVERASKYKKGGAPVRDVKQLRANAYRVLLTRARDGTIVFVPPLDELDETYAYLVNCGFEVLT
jgi:hypothetical protein